MEINNQEDLIYCVHCEENVTRPTYRRHQLLVLKRKHDQTASESESDSGSSNSESSDDSASTTESVEIGRLTLLMKVVIEHPAYMYSVNFF